MLRLCDKYFLGNKMLPGSVEKSKKNYSKRVSKKNHRTIDFERFFYISELVENSELESSLTNLMNTKSNNILYFSSDTKSHYVTVYSNKAWELGYINSVQDASGDDDSLSIFILTDKTNTNYIMTGIINKYPFIQTNNFSFNGRKVCTKYEDYLRELGEKPKRTEIYATILLFFHDFVDNNY